MAMRSLLLWLVLLFLLINGWTFIKSTTTTYQASSSYTFIARRALASKFDRLHRHRHHHHRHHSHPVGLESNSRMGLDVVPASLSPVDDGNEIDPRYGVEKRLVPTGPNPLHH